MSTKPQKFTRPSLLAWIALESAKRGLPATKTNNIFMRRGFVSAQLALQSTLGREPIEQNLITQLDAAAERQREEQEAKANGTLRQLYEQRNGRPFLTKEQQAQRITARRKQQITQLQEQADNGNLNAGALARLEKLKAAEQ